MLTIKNDRLSVEIDEAGAQITHVIAKNGNFDYIWNGPQWARHAPILFPAIGRSNQDHYRLDGQTYEMPQHGFARDYPLTVVDKGDDRVSLTLMQNDETLAKFPFHFELMVTYRLEEEKLHVKFLVKNNSDREMPYALGLHPGFNVPLNGDELNFDDYQLTFSPEVTQLQQFEIDPVPFRTGQVIDVSGSVQGTLPLTHARFDDGLIIIENQGLTSVTLSSPKSTHHISVSLEDFPYVALWTLEHQEAGFICLEPFAGLPDVKADEPTDWRHKEGNEHLEAGHDKAYQTTIDFQ